MTYQGLVVRGLTVTYPGRPPRVAVDGASLTVAPGESVALVGASGSGKSSLLLAIAGVIGSTGVLTWDGVDLHTVPTHRRGVGLVFQDGQLFPHLSVGENVAFGLAMRGVSRAEQEATVSGLLDLMGLPGAQSRRVDELSGGERQRVALARTLAPAPRLVLLDEPLSSLDADLRARLAIEVRDALAACGAASIVVTHDMDEARAMATRIVTVTAGRLGDAEAREA